MSRATEMNYYLCNKVRLRVNEGDRLWPIIITPEKFLCTVDRTGFVLTSGKMQLAKYTQAIGCSYTYIIPVKKCKGPKA